MSNTKEIVNAFRNNLNNRKNIKELHSTISNLHQKIMNQSIPDILKIYMLVFKNIHTDKKSVCKINEFGSNDWTDYYEPSGEKRLLFLNRDGFSVSSSFRAGEDDRVDTSRTNYIHTFSHKALIKIFKRLLENKDTIINSIEKEYKKNIAIRFFKAFEESGCNNLFDYNQDFDFLRQDIKLSVEYYNNDAIEKVKIDLFQYKNASGSISVSKSSSYGSRNSIELNDIEKCSQIYDELMAFLNQYLEQLKRQDDGLIKFVVLLKDAFAKELVLNALKDKPDGK